MTRGEFRTWARMVATMYAHDGPRCGARDWAAKIRPFDAELADLYVRAAEANEAIRSHVVGKAEAGKDGDDGNG